MRAGRAWGTMLAVVGTLLAARAARADIPGAPPGRYDRDPDCTAARQQRDGEHCAECAFDTPVACGAALSPLGYAQRCVTGFGPRGLEVWCRRLGCDEPLAAAALASSRALAPPAPSRGACAAAAGTARLGDALVALAMLAGGALAWRVRRRHGAPREAPGGRRADAPAG